MFSADFYPDSVTRSKKFIKCMLKALLQRCYYEQYQIVCKKLWHPRRLGCNCLFNAHIGYETEWRQHTLLSESNTNGERSWLNSPDTDAYFWAGMQWLEPIAWKGLGSQSISRETRPHAFLEEVNKACVDVFATLPRFHKKLLRRAEIWSVMLRPERKPHWASFSFDAIISLHLFSKHLAT